MRTYLLVSGLIFGVVALAHVARVAYGAAVQVGSWSVPLELSWGGMVVAGALCVWAFTLSRGQRGA
jgi:hypothetical protein